MSQSVLDINLLVLYCFIYNKITMAEPIKVDAVPTRAFPTEQEIGYNPDRFYQESKAQILNTIESARRTRRFKNLPATSGINYENYNEFCKTVPVINSNDLFPSLDLIPGGATPYLPHPSGGSTGKRMKKIFLSPDATVISLNEFLIKSLRDATNPVLIHKNLKILSYKVTEDSLKVQAPNVILKTYLSTTEFAEQIKDHEVVYVTEQVSKFRELMDHFSNMPEDQLRKIVQGKKFFIEIGAEPIKIEEIQKWYTLLEHVSGVTPEFWGLYGTTETLLVGLGVYKPGDKELRYEVKNNIRFVEVLRKDVDIPVRIGEEGRVVVTPLRPNYDGTNIVRYDTGDFATLGIERGKMYLTDIHRKPGDGMISLWGHKIYAPQIHDMLADKLQYPINIEVGSDTIPTNDDREQIVLTMNVYSERFIDPKEVDTAQIKMYEVLETAIDGIQGMVESGKLKVVTHFDHTAPPDIIKDWRIIPTELLRNQVEEALRTYYNG